MNIKEYKQVSEIIERYYEEMDKENIEFQKKFQLSCVSSCAGVCCKSNEVSVSPIDLIPLALELAESEQIRDIVDQLMAAKNSSCFFWKNGLCDVYKKRAILCRLFGVSGVFDKHGNKRLSVCSYIKNEMEIAKAVENAQYAPNIVLWSNKVNNLLPSWDSSVKPFNQALLYALDKILIAKYYEEIS